MKKRKSGARIARICKNCESEFQALAVKVRQGGGLFCSSKCYQTHRSVNKRTKAEQQRIDLMKHRYGVDLDQYEEMLERQNQQCAICQDKFNGVLTGGKSFDGKACIDHCHTSGRVRGLLCSKCNTGLGGFRDNIESLQRAIDYLQS